VITSVFPEMTAEKKSYVWLVSDYSPKFIVLLSSKNEAIELFIKYFKVDKSLTVSEV
jgi:hypothetical protein